METSPKVWQAEGKTGNPYSLLGRTWSGEHDKAIIDAIVKENGFRTTHSSSLWKKFENDKVVLGRTAEEMKRRFHETILSQLGRYGISKFHLKEFQDIAKTEMPNSCHASDIPGPSNSKSENKHRSVFSQESYKNSFGDEEGNATHTSESEKVEDAQTKKQYSSAESEELKQGDKKTICCSESRKRKSSGKKRDCLPESKERKSSAKKRVKSTKTGNKKRKRGPQFTSADDVAILDDMVRYDDAKILPSGNKYWEALVSTKNEKLVGRTSQSLRERFFNSIIHKLKVYFEQDEYKCLKKKLKLTDHWRERLLMSDKSNDTDSGTDEEVSLSQKGSDEDESENDGHALSSENEDEEGMNDDDDNNWEVADTVRDSVDESSSIKDHEKNIETEFDDIEAGDPTQKDNNHQNANEGFEEDEGSSTDAQVEFVQKACENSQSQNETDVGDDSDLKSGLKPYTSDSTDDLFEDGRNAKACFQQNVENVSPKMNNDKMIVVASNNDLVENGENASPIKNDEDKIQKMAVNFTRKIISHINSSNPEAKDIADNLLSQLVQSNRHLTYILKSQGKKE